jgi:serine O-acetyltransferase
VGVPGRIVYRSGVRVDPLEHGNLPDSEANVIRTLVDRIEQLESQIQELKQVQSQNHSLVASAIENLWETEEELLVGKTCLLKDKQIREFLDGSGI